MTDDTLIQRTSRWISTAWKNVFRPGDSPPAPRDLAPSPDELFALVQHSPIVSLLVDSERRIRTLNRAGKQFAGRTTREAIGLRAGRLFRCINSGKSPRGCGYSEACEQCGIRLAVADTCRTGEPNWKKEADIPLPGDDGGERMVHLLVSTAPVQMDGDALVAVWLEDVTSLKRAQKKLDKLASHDALTGLPNRRRLNEELDREIARATRHESPLSLAMLDLDGFKSVNDTLGHDTGDSELQKMARMLQNSVRAEDLVARCGGDEFFVIMPHTCVEKGRQLAERIRRKYRDMADPGDGCHTTVSIGITELNPGEARADVIERADAMLYEAKKRGGDCEVGLTARQNCPADVGA